MIVGAIKPNSDDTEELSMKAPMSVSKPAISGRGSRTVRLRQMVTGGRGHDVLPRFRPLYLGSAGYDTDIGAFIESSSVLSSLGLMAPSIIDSDAIQGETFLPG